MITLTTDFGYQEPFVGQLKGVILSQSHGARPGDSHSNCPDARPDIRIVDLTHGIKSHDIRAAALAIGASYRYFPSGTVHLVVVDPGVGSSRASIILEACGHMFVGPDNGVFSMVCAACPEHRVWRIDAPGLMLKSPGNTFHGRDVFAPVAAALDGGRAPHELGVPMSGLVTLPLPAASLRDGVLHGEVVHLDVFGNAITNIGVEALEAMRREAPGGMLVAEAGGQVCPLVEYYAQGVSGPHALINSDGFLEVFVFEDSAAKTLALAVGSPVMLRPL